MTIRNFEFTIWNYALREVSKYGLISGPYFPAFGLIFLYFVNLRIHSKYRELRTRNNCVFGHFSRSVWLLYYCESSGSFPILHDGIENVIKKYPKLSNKTAEQDHTPKPFPWVLFVDQQSIIQTFIRHNYKEHPRKNFCTDLLTTNVPII